MENTRLHGRPWQSRLIPYEEEILALRRRRPPMPFDQITARLATKYGMKVHLDTVHNFVKVRLGLYRKIRGSDLRAGPSSKIRRQPSRKQRNPSGTAFITMLEFNSQSNQGQP